MSLTLPILSQQTPPPRQRLPEWLRRPLPAGNSSNTFDMGEAAAIQPDGKVLIAGITQGTNADQFGLVRLLASSSGGTEPG